MLVALVVKDGHFPNFAFAVPESTMALWRGRSASWKSVLENNAEVNIYRVSDPSWKFLEASGRSPQLRESNPGSV